MNTPRFLTVLTIVNLVLLVFLLQSRTQPAVATSVGPVLRGGSLEIVDGRGRVRASIKLHPAQTGGKSPETVMFRLIDENGRPEVKIGASVEGGGMSVVGDSDKIQAILQADGSGSSLRLKNGGLERVIEPF